MVVVFIITIMIIIIIWHDRWWWWWWWSDLNRKTKQKNKSCTKTSRVGKVSPRRQKVELCIRNDAAKVSYQRTINRETKVQKKSKTQATQRSSGSTVERGGEQTRAKRLGWAVWTLPLSLQQHTCAILTPSPPPLSPIRVLLSRSGDWNAALIHDKDVAQ